MCVPPHGLRQTALSPVLRSSPWSLQSPQVLLAPCSLQQESGGGRARRAQVVRSQKVREEAAVLMALVPACRSGRRVSARPPRRPSCPECSGPRLFCSMGDGRGFAFAEQIISLWAQQGVHNGREVLQSLDFSVDEKVNLLELTWALEKEVMLVGGAAQQAALACYPQELRFCQEEEEQMAREQDKARQDLEKAEQRNLEFVKETDDLHSALEQLAEEKVSVGAPSWTSGPALLGPELFPGCRLHALLLGLVAAVAGGSVWLCPQDLQDHSDELQAALQGLQAQTAPSRHSHLPLGHGPGGTITFVGDSAPASTETEIMLEQLKERCQELRIQLETQNRVGKAF
ncbi:unnamed protein product [Rangifer tarandus platyrhynchus]|uniref:Uncharacterized protein n=1 Tax=Rangifer tarandus platyrhynchus TaxID=3082113 RepID=A0AC59Y7K9_RANTA